MTVVVVVAVAVTVAVVGVLLLVMAVSVSMVMVVLCLSLESDTMSTRTCNIPCRNDMTSTFSPKPTHPMMRTSLGSSIATTRSAVLNEIGRINRREILINR